ncbi:hypothetical protein KQI42_17125 [Tissierella sp. MSJ-40]|jgi:hypothetical protein|uniref:Uncharacterized protein n=1 Tax=Tissierella simiarum TaxID=2841534 RepID=A0ABS6E9Y0_9FIRM|nr:DUF6550 family protein [Tissierella simiarum]MBU5439740.1 hypothetical protein [Tissierella simiarum]
MKNISDKTKKWLVVTGGLVICAMLILMIGSQFRKEPIEDTLPNQNIEVDDVTIEKLKDTEKAEKEEVTNDEDKTNNEKEDEIIVPPIKTPDTQSTNKNGVDKGTEQTIQKNAEKPKEPTKEQLTDPTQKPNGEKVTEPPVNVDHEKVEKPEELPKQKDEPKGGDKKDGKIYVPGFGWIDDIGEGEGTKAEDMYENGNKVGNMD